MQALGDIMPYHHAAPLQPSATPPASRITPFRNDSEPKGGWTGDTRRKPQLPSTGDTPAAPMHHPTNGPPQGGVFNLQHWKIRKTHFLKCLQKATKATWGWDALLV